MNEDATLLHQRVAKGSTAVGLDEHDDALYFPLGRRVRFKFLVLGLAIPALLVAVKQRDGVFSVLLNAVLSAAHGSERHEGARVSVIKLRRSRTTMSVLKKQTFDKSSIRKPLVALEYRGADGEPRRVSVVQHFVSYSVWDVVVDQART